MLAAAGGKLCAPLKTRRQFFKRKSREPIGGVQGGSCAAVCRTLMSLHEVYVKRGEKKTERRILARQVAPRSREEKEADGLGKGFGSGSPDRVDETMDQGGFEHKSILTMRPISMCGPARPVQKVFRADGRDTVSPKEKILRG